MATKHTLVKSFAQHGRPGFGASTEDVKAYKEAAEALNAEALANWDSPEFHRQVAADLSSSLDYGFKFDNLFSTYFNTEHVGEFDRVAIKERRGLKAFFTARGGYIDESTLTNQEWEVPRDTLGFHISEEDGKLRSNFADSIGDVAALGGERMDAEVNRRIFSLLQAAIPSSSPFYISGAGMSQASLNTAITAVKDAIKPSGTTGPTPVTVIGRSTMIDQISNFTGFSPWALEEIRQDGFLGTYRGAQVISLHNFTDEDDLSYIPANELWVFGGNVGKFVSFGDMRVKTWSENTVDYTHYRGALDCGGIVTHPEQARRVIDTTITP